MPLTKVNGEYRTPGGCSAWNGRCFNGAEHDFKCDIAYISFARSGWYRRPQTPLYILRDWFEGNEDPGCEWNSTRGAEFRASWKAIRFEEFQITYRDYVFNTNTLMFEPATNRPVEDWFEPCIPETEA
jgi:hypothetical protein